MIGVLVNCSPAETSVQLTRELLGWTFGRQRYLVRAMEQVWAGGRFWRQKRTEPTWGLQDVRGTKSIRPMRRGNTALEC